MQASTAGTQATGGGAAEVGEQPADATVDAVTAQLGAVIKQAMHGSQGAMLTALEELGITLSQLKALGALEQQEQIPLGELAERMQLSLPAVSRIVDGLVKRGWVTREEAPADRRCKLVQITPEALSTYRELAALRISALRAFVETLSSEELEALAPGLHVLAQRPEIAAHLTEEVASR
jgi:DNA-binding MarR family transcriptional regulator